MATNWRSWLEGLVPGWLQGYWGQRLIGVLGLVADVASQGAAEAVRAPWLAEASSPDDCLDLVGEEQMMPRYPTETADQYRARLLKVWDTWPFAGSAQAIEAQLRAAGFDATVEFHDDREGPRGETAPYYSQFWVRIDATPTYANPAWGDFDWNDGTDWGPADLSPSDAQLVRSIIRKWKPADWVCRGFGINTEMV